MLKNGSLKKAEETKEMKVDFVSRAILALHGLFGNRKKTIIIGTLVISIISIYFISTIHIDSQMVKYFKDDSTVAQDDRYLNENFAGTNFLDITVKGTKAGDLAEPAILMAMDSMATTLKENILR